MYTYYARSVKVCTHAIYVSRDWGADCVLGSSSSRLGMFWPLTGPKWAQERRAIDFLPHGSSTEPDSWVTSPFLCFRKETIAP